MGFILELFRRLSGRTVLKNTKHSPACHCYQCRVWHPVSAAQQRVIESHDNMAIYGGQIGRKPRYSDAHLGATEEV